MNALFVCFLMLFINCFIEDLLFYGGSSVLFGDLLFYLGIFCFIGDLLFYWGSSVLSVIFCFIGDLLSFST